MAGAWVGKLLAPSPGSAGLPEMTYTGLCSTSLRSASLRGPTPSVLLPAPLLLLPLQSGPSNPSYHPPLPNSILLPAGRCPLSHSAVSGFTVSYCNGRLPVPGPYLSWQAHFTSA